MSLMMMMMVMMMISNAFSSHKTTSDSGTCIPILQTAVCNELILPSAWLYSFSLLYCHYTYMHTFYLNQTLSHKKEDRQKKRR